MSSYIIKSAQEEKLRKLARRVRRDYVSKILIVPALKGIPGDVSITAGSWKVFAKLVRMVKRIIPEFLGSLKEHGHGWHYCDKSPYYYTDFVFFVEND